MLPSPFYASNTLTHSFQKLILGSPWAMLGPPSSPPCFIDVNKSHLFLNHHNSLHHHQWRSAPVLTGFAVSIACALPRNFKPRQERPIKVSRKNQTHARLEMGPRVGLGFGPFSLFSKHGWTAATATRLNTRSIL